MKTLSLLILIAMAPASAFAQQSVSIPTYSPENYTNILDGSYKQRGATISGQLYMPVQISKTVPAVIIMHGSGGIREDTEVTVAERLQKSGIAAFIVDSFRGRGMSGTGTDQGKLSMAASVLDSLQALLALREQPKIDGTRVGVVGFSRGGVAAMFSNQEPLRRSVLGDSGGFAVHVPVYPGCSTQWDAVAPSKSPLLFLLGEDDDLTPASKCKRYAERINNAGGSAQAIAFPGASHQFLREQRREVSKAANFADCEMGIKADGEMHYPKLGISVGNDWRGFVRKVFRDCGKRGFNAGGTAEIRIKALNAISDFFQQHLLSRR